MTAEPTINTISKNPRTSEGLRRHNGNRRFMGVTLGGGTSVTRSCAEVRALVIGHPWIEERVGDIGQQVDEDDQDRKNKGQSLHDRIVAG